MIKFLTTDSQFTDVFHGITLNARQALCFQGKDHSIVSFWPGKAWN